MPPIESKTPGDRGEPHRAEVEARLRTLEHRLADVETRLPDSLVIHPRFWVRVAAIVGHILAAVLFLQAIVVAAVLAFAIVQFLGRLLGGT